MYLWCVLCLTQMYIGVAPRPSGARVGARHWWESTELLIVRISSICVIIISCNIYIYIYRDREREREIHTYYTTIHISIVIIIVRDARASDLRLRGRTCSTLIAAWLLSLRGRFLSDMGKSPRLSTRDSYYYYCNYYVIIIIIIIIIIMIMFIMCV